MPRATQRQRPLFR